MTNLTILSRQNMTVSRVSRANASDLFRICRPIRRCSAVSSQLPFSDLIFNLASVVWTTKTEEKLQFCDNSVLQITNIKPVSIKIVNKYIKKNLWCEILTWWFCWEGFSCDCCELKLRKRALALSCTLLVSYVKFLSKNWVNVFLKILRGKSELKLFKYGPNCPP